MINDTAVVPITKKGEIAVCLDAYVTVAIKLCTRSLESSMEAMKLAYAACATCAHLPEAEWALSNAEVLMAETSRRVRLALKLYRLAHTPQPPADLAPQPVAADTLDDSCIDTACSSRLLQKQSLLGHAEQQTQYAADQAQTILMQIQKLQQQLLHHRQNMQPGQQPGQMQLQQQQPDGAHCLTQAAQAQQLLQQPELHSTSPMMPQEATAACAAVEAVLQEEVGSSWEWPGLELRCEGKAVLRML